MFKSVAMWMPVNSFYKWTRIPQKWSVKQTAITDMVECEVSKGQSQQTTAKSKTLYTQMFTWILEFIPAFPQCETWIRETGIQMQYFSYFNDLSYQQK